jgi:hypothetical protein
VIVNHLLHLSKPRRSASSPTSGGDSGIAGWALTLKRDGLQKNLKRVYGSTRKNG